MESSTIFTLLFVSTKMQRGTQQERREELEMLFEKS